MCHSKQLQEGLMVFSDDFLHFLKIKKNNCRIHQNYLVALMFVLYHGCLWEPSVSHKGRICTEFDKGLLTCTVLWVRINGW